jgi:glucose-6-phosphate dehydrogenase assembly protein OpcA
VNLGEVVAALPELRREAAGREAATRTAVMTIVMVVGPNDDQDACAASVRSLGARHPCRAVVLRPDPDSTPVIDATATLWRAEPAASEGHPSFFEELHLDVGGQAASHLASIVGPFILPDLPVAMWFPGDLPDPTDPLLRLASVLMVDTRLVGPGLVAIGHSYRTLLELANHQPVVDLSWVRLQPWRELLAGLFEPEHNRHFLDDVRSAAVKGKPGPRHMLGGWLMAQLDLRARELVLTDSKHVDITLEASYGGEEGKFQVSRDEGARGLWAKASLSGGMAHGQAMPLPDDSLTSALSSAISNLRADRVWERALAAAAALAS